MLDPRHDDPRHHLATRRPFNKLGDELIDKLAVGSRVIELSRGDCLFHIGEKPEHVFLILRGMLQLRRTTAKDEHSLMALFGTGDVPAIPVLLSGGRYGADAVVVSAHLSALRVPAGPLLELAETDVRVATAFNRALLDHVRALHEKVAILSAGSVEQRLAKLFAVLCERFGDELEGGSHCVPIVLTRAEIAAFVSARVETVIRTLSLWQKRGIVTSNEDGFEISDPQVLQSILRGDA